MAEGGGGKAPIMDALEVFGSSAGERKRGGGNQ